jgi:hypothetical protein
LVAKAGFDAPPRPRAVKKTAACIALALAFGAGEAKAQSPFDTLSDQAWDAAKGFIPSTAWDGPNVIRAATPGHWGYWNPRKGLVKVPPAMARALMNPKNPRHDFAFANLLHEYAHSLQDFYLDRRTREGAADLWSRWVAPRVARALGVPYDGARYGYPDKAAWVKAHYPATWWQGGIDPTRSQFG